jgi:hypothetical protein
MKEKWVVFAALATFSFLAAGSSSPAVDTRAIDKIRSKAVLSQQDLQVIDDFVADGVQELLQAKKFTDIARLRTIILSRQSTQNQYAQQFSKSARKHITAALQQASMLPEDRRVKVTINLMMLIDGLEDLMLTNLSVAMLNSKNAVVRYWAVHSITNPGIIKQLNSGDATTSQLARAIAGKLKDLVGSSNPETMGLIARFAGDVQIAQAEQLLLEIANTRIKQYAAWKVEYELLDGALLKLLADKIISGSADKSAVAHHFCQLYSCAIQRYVNGKDRLSDAQKQQLASVLVGTEDSCIGKLMGAPQSAIKRAVEREDDQGLWTEHNRLLGSDTKTGALPLKLKFKYGPDSSGKERNGPLALPRPPRSGLVK